jgi:hypothetical protein
MVLKLTKLQALNPPDPNQEIGFCNILQKEKWRLRVTPALESKAVLIPSICCVLTALPAPTPSRRSTLYLWGPLFFNLGNVELKFSWKLLFL